MIIDLKVSILSASVSRQAGGLLGSMLGLVNAVEKENIIIKIISLDDENTKKDLRAWGDCCVKTFPTYGPKFFGYSPGMKFELIKSDCDLVHLHGLWMYPSVATVQWSQHSGKPYIVTPHGMLDPWAIMNSSWKKKLAGSIYENVNLRGAACIHALCEPEFRAIRAYGLKGPIAIIPNGVDLPNLKSQLPRSEWCTGLPPDAKVLLFLGRLHPKKGLQMLLHAWAKAHKHGVPSVYLWKLVIAGWDQSGHRAELEQLVDELAIRDSVYFVGPQFDLAKAACLTRADAFILPSFSEGLPMAVLEAWAYSLPVLMTPNCNLPDGIAAGAAIQIETNIDSVVDGLGSLFGMCDSERLSIGQRGRELVEKQYTWSRVGFEMTQVYSWILGRGPRPDCVRSD